MSPVFSIQGGMNIECIGNLPIWGHLVAIISIHSMCIQEKVLIYSNVCINANTSHFFFCLLKELIPIILMLYFYAYFWVWNLSSWIHLLSNLLLMLEENERNLSMSDCTRENFKKVTICYLYRGRQEKISVRAEIPVFS